MARAKSSEQQRSRSKPNAAEELTRGITTLRELSIQIEDLSRDGFPYREAVRARTELSFRETIRRLFGEKSPEYQAHKNHKLRIGNRTECALSTTPIKELIAVLENQKADLLGLKPDEPAAPAPADPERPMPTAVPPPQPSDSIPGPGAQSTAPLVTLTTPDAPVPLTVAMTTNLSQPVSSIPSLTMTTPVAATSAPMPGPSDLLPQPIRDTSIPRPLQQPPLPPGDTTATESPTVPRMTIAPRPAAPPSLTPVSASTTPSVPTGTPSNATARFVPSAAPMPPISSTPTPIPQGTIPPVPHTTLRPTPLPLSQAEPLPTRQPALQPLAILAPTPAPIAPVPMAPPQPSPEATPAKPAHDHLGLVSESRPQPLPIQPPKPGASTPESKPKPEPVVTAVLAPPIPASTPEPAQMPKPDRIAAENGTLEILRRICARFHLVARQLRLRKEYRPTLEVNDEVDLQDLFYALLRLQFDEVGTEEWSPAYTNGARRTSYLLDWEKTVVVVKQTRSGLTTKDLAEQIAADKSHYSARPNGAALVCFIYDPDGRVGNPRGLEADLTSAHNTYKVEVIVAPK